MSWIGHILCCQIGSGTGQPVPKLPASPKLSHSQRTNKQRVTAQSQNLRFVVNVEVKALRKPGTNEQAAVASWTGSSFELVDVQATLRHYRQIYEDNVWMSRQPLPSGRSRSSRCPARRSTGVGKSRYLARCSPAFSSCRANASQALTSPIYSCKCRSTAHSVSSSWQFRSPFISWHGSAQL